MSPRAADPLSTNPTMVGSSRATSSSSAACAAWLITPRDASVVTRGPPSSSDLRPPVRVHRAGRAVGDHEDPLAGIAHSAAVGADYCEFDVRRTTDGTFVIAHDPDLGGDPIRTLDWPTVHARAPEVLRLEQLLAALAATGMGAHVDVKFETSGSARREGESWESDLLAVLADALPADRIVMTTGRRSATRAMRAWAVERRSGLLVGMSIGASIRGLSVDRGRTPAVGPGVPPPAVRRLPRRRGRRALRARDHPAVALDDEDRRPAAGVDRGQPAASAPAAARPPDLDDHHQPSRPGVPDPRGPPSLAWPSALGRRDHPPPRRRPPEADAWVDGPRPRPYEIGSWSTTRRWPAAFARVDGAGPRRAGRPGPRDPPRRLDVRRGPPRQAGDRRRPGRRRPRRRAGVRPRPGGRRLRPHGPRAVVARAPPAQARRPGRPTSTSSAPTARRSSGT